MEITQRGNPEKQKKVNVTLAMKKSIILFFLVISTGVTAQNNKNALESIGFSVNWTCNPGEWCMAENGVAIVGFQTTKYGYKSLLDMWIQVKTNLDMKYGEGIESRKDVQPCSICSGNVMDYDVWHTGLQAGDAWIIFSHDYEIQRLRLVFKANSEGYVIGLLNM